MSDHQTLLDFGFSPEKVERALKATKKSGLQPALDWLEAHGDDKEGDEDKDDDEEGEGDSNQVNVGQANSLKCLECSKVFANSSLASWHGEKSGHSQFEESTDTITPLTAEQKAERLNELKAKMDAKRKERNAKESEESKQNEAIRRKGGKDLLSIKEDIKLKEAEKEAIQRKRDKVETNKARARVLLEIEADKKARADKAAAEKAKRQGQPPPTAAAPTRPQGEVVVSQGTTRTYAEARLQLRLPTGDALVTTLPSDTPLQSVVDWLLQQSSTQEAGISDSSIKISTTFPRRMFTDTDMNQTLAKLELTPSAVLIVTK